MGFYGKCFFYFSCLILSVCTSSCQFEDGDSSGFYNYNKDWDLWRVPLIAPYEVFSPTNNSPESDDWFFELDSAQVNAEDYTPYSKIDQFGSFSRVGILDSVIVFEMEKYWSVLSGSTRTILMIDAKTDSAFLYARDYHSESYGQKVEELNLQGIEMLDWAEVKDNFIENLVLPESWGVTDEQ